MNLWFYGFQILIGMNLRLSGSSELVVLESFDLGDSLQSLLALLPPTVLPGAQILEIKLQKILSFITLRHFLSFVATDEFFFSFKTSTDGYKNNYFWSNVVRTVIVIFNFFHK
jgi:hypothetical protein